MIIVLKFGAKRQRKISPESWRHIATKTVKKNVKIRIFVGGIFFSDAEIAYFLSEIAFFLQIFTIGIQISECTVFIAWKQPKFRAEIIGKLSIINRHYRTLFVCVSSSPIEWLKNIVIGDRMISRRCNALLRPQPDRPPAVTSFPCHFPLPLPPRAAAAGAAGAASHSSQ